MKRFVGFNLQNYSSLQVYKSELARKDEELRKIQKNMAQWKVRITIFASLFIHRKIRRENLPKNLKSSSDDFLKMHQPWPKVNLALLRM